MLLLMVILVLLRPRLGTPYGDSWEFVWGQAHFFASGAVLQDRTPCWNMARLSQFTAHVRSFLPCPKVVCRRKQLEISCTSCRKKRSHPRSLAGC